MSRRGGTRSHAGGAGLQLSTLTCQSQRSLDAFGSVGLSGGGVVGSVVGSGSLAGVLPIGHFLIDFFFLFSRDQRDDKDFFLSNGEG